MAPSYKFIPMAMLLIFAMVAPNLQQSAAINAEEGAAKAGKTAHAVVAPAPSPRGAPMKLKWFLLPDFPCLPFLPKILLDLCHVLFPPPSPSPPPAPPVKECRSSLTKKLVPPCTGFLTNSSESEPSSNCCQAINSFFDDHTTTPYCLCHLVRGSVGKLLPAPIINNRTVGVLVECIGLDPSSVTGICDPKNEFPVPPMDDPSGPPRI
ncbi:hypothetical protein EJB05_10580 [Eragrostis curvula]|uniref:Bifunctional inhibitor/plant lipid transfer protein/seed storage helical domain-containing protein n=1 Tax=Eragrostis curvula TaxID=38414 RepID=A0A5J9VP80_9POAL|nr:hypothetical protein EJB05_10580 [Eragrostis curvula]